MMKSEDVEQRVHAAVGRALGRFVMLRPGDRVAVGVSGGKDSLTLLGALAAHRRHAPFAYEIVAVTIEQGKFKQSIENLRAPIARLGVEWVVREDRDTLGLVKNGVVHGCDVCSRHRRRSLYRLAGELGATARSPCYATSSSTAASRRSRRWRSPDAARFGSFVRSCS
jgi:tRNA 2-thiocytidine biosynthesis protein TtcA